MKLFLSSLASQTLPLVRSLLPDNPNKLKVAYIATAMDPYLGGEQFPWMAEGREKLIEMGFNVTNYDFKGKTAEQLRHDLGKFQVIYVDGGNTFYLLNEMKKSGFDLILKDLLYKGINYIGSSAGSCVMGPSLDYLVTIDHPEIVPEFTDYNCLGLIKERIVPHAGRAKYVNRHAKLAKDFNKNLTFLRDDQALVVNDDKIEIVSN